jgi:hypothetical protein
MVLRVARTKFECVKLKGSVRGRSKEPGEGSSYWRKGVNRVENCRQPLLRIRDVLGVGSVE